MSFPTNAPSAADAPCSPRIVYVSWTRLPSTLANAVQVVRMVNALAANGAAEVRLIARRAPGERRTTETIAAECGLDPRVKLALLPSSRILAGLRLFLFSGSGANGKIDAIYSRVLPIFLRRFPIRSRIFEMHEPPRANWLLKPVVFDRIVRTGNLTDIVYISESLRNITEREHSAALGPSGINRTVLHSGGAAPGAYVGEPEGGPFTLAYAGRLDKLDCDLVAALAEADPDLRIAVYGARDSGGDRLERISNVELHGWITPAELPARLRAAHVLIGPYARLPSTEWFSPVKIFDYAAAGRPMLISEHGPVREIFPDEVIGRILPPSDPASWIAAVAELRENTAKREEMGRAGIAFASAYSFEARARSIIDLIGAGSPIRTSLN